MTPSPDKPAPPAKAPARRRISTGAARNPESERAILDAAEEILVTEGPAGLSFEAVARRAGAGKPTLYRRWPTRAALILAVHGRQKPWLTDVDTGSLEGDLDYLFRELWRFWSDTPGGNAVRCVIAEAQANPAARPALEDYVSQIRAHLAPLLERARARGEAADDVDGEVFQELLFGFNWVRLLTADTEPPAEKRQAAARMIARAVGRGR